MDISLLNSLTARISPQSPVIDLLGQLKAAGNIEAEVARLLTEGLLLNTRLGQIRTSNRLHLQPGDRVRLSLETTTQGPILKIKPAPITKPPQIVELSSKLKQALPTQRAEIGRVLSVSAQQMKISIGQHRLDLPRLPSFESGQLLVLQRSSLQDKVEIRTLDRAAVFKALIKHLLPRHIQSGEKPLMQLLNRLGENNRSAPAKTTFSMQQPVTLDRAKYPRSGATVSEPIAKTLPLRSASLSRPNATAKPAKTSIEARQSGQVAPLRTASEQNQASAASSTRTIKAVSTQPSANFVSNLSVNKPEPARPSGAKARAVILSDSRISSQAQESSPKPAPSMPPSKLPSASQKLPGSTLKSLTQAGSSPATSKADVISTKRHSNNPQIPASPRSVIGIEAPGSPAKTLPAKASATSTFSSGIAQGRSVVSSTQLSALFQAIPKLVDLTPTRIRQWFSFSGLLPLPTTAPSPSHNADPYLILRQVANSAITEFDPVFYDRRPTSGTEEIAGKRSADELLWLSRDNVKLLEQALTHNTLQRASLGLQQEAQQPLNMSFALPLHDEKEFKSIHIELSQQDQAAPDQTQGWEIRISFEFAELGEISCHISLAGDRVAARFYCAHQATQTRVEQELPNLRQQLVEVGFETGELHSYAMTPGVTKHDTILQAADALIDIEV